MARYTLMNKTTPVLDFEYDLEAHLATRITAVHNVAAAPLGLFDERGQTNKKELNYWWRHRAIPSSREQIDRLLDNLNLKTTLELAERNFGLSLWPIPRPPRRHRTPAAPQRRDPVRRGTDGVGAGQHRCLVAHLSILRQMRCSAVKKGRSASQKPALRPKMSFGGLQKAAFDRKMTWPLKARQTAGPPIYQHAVPFGPFAY